jgi:hypothetical protein
MPPTANLPIDDTSPLLLIEEAAQLVREGALRLVRWCRRDEVPCAVVDTGKGEYLIPLGVVCEIMPGLLAA